MTFDFSLKMIVRLEYTEFYIIKVNFKLILFITTWVLSGVAIRCVVNEDVNRTNGLYSFYTNGSLFRVAAWRVYCRRLWIIVRVTL